MICGNCGKTLDDNSMFCTSCGHIAQRDALQNQQSEQPEAAVVLNEESDAFSADDNSGAAERVDEAQIIEALSSENLTEKNDDASSDELTEVFEEISEEGFTDSFQEDLQADLQEDLQEDLREDFQEDFREGAGESLEEIFDESGNQTAEEQNDRAAKGANGKMIIAIIMLSAALLAVTGLYIIDKVFYNKPAQVQPSTILIVTQPEDLSLKENDNAVFYVEAEGLNLTYQWYYRKAGDEMWHLWKTHDKAKTKAVANKSWDGMQVYCTITDNNRNTVASDIATITVENSSGKNEKKSK